MRRRRRASPGSWRRRSRSGDGRRRRMRGYVVGALVLEARANQPLPTQALGAPKAADVGGVSAFGFAGTIAHAVLEAVEAPTAGARLRPLRSPPALPFALPAAVLARAPPVTAFGAPSPWRPSRRSKTTSRCSLRCSAVRAVGGAADATADTTLLEAGVVESIAAVELLGRLAKLTRRWGCGRRSSSSARGCACGICWWMRAIQTNK